MMTLADQTSSHDGSIPRGKLNDAIVGFGKNLHRMGQTPRHYTLMSCLISRPHSTHQGNDRQLYQYWTLFMHISVKICTIRCAMDCDNAVYCTAGSVHTVSA